MKASSLLVQALENEGVQFIFGVPGEENLDLLDSLSRSSIRFVLTRHEQAAGFMAATYGRLTGKVGVALATLGPGATNLVTAAAYAQLGGMPMLMITGQKPIKTNKQAMFQLIDVVDMMQPITKHSHQLVSGANIPARIREAIRRAEEERPGAVHLELPEDIAREDVDQPLLEPSLVRRPVAEAKSLRAAVELISYAHRPLLLIGAGANRKLTCKSLRRFQQHTGIPFVTTQMGKGVMDENHPQFLGNAALSSGDFVHRAIEAADVIINVGHDVVEKPPFWMRHEARKVIHVNFLPASVDPVYFPQIEVVGDIAHSIWQFTELLNPQPNWDFSFYERVRTANEAHLQERTNDPSFPIFPERLVADVRQVMPEHGIVALDNGIYKIWFARNYKAPQPNTVLLDNALAAMGAGLPSAIAAKLVYPDRPVLSVCGDGGFMMSSQELETAVRLNLDLVVLILQDNAYGMIKWKQSHMGLDDFGLDFQNPDFVQYAASYGATGHRVETADQLSKILADCLQRSGVHVIVVPVDYSLNDRIFHEDIQRLSAQVM
jgi:acetolactate synthase-1/2/3 large subunit